MKKLLQNIIKSCPLICSLFILCFHLQNGLAQNLNNSPKIDQKKWEKIAEKYDYSSIQKAPKKEKPTNNEIKIEPIQKAEKAENGQSNNLVSYALFALVIIALIYIGYRIIRNGQFWNNKNIVREKVYTLENLEANLAEVDIDPFLKQALSENNYRLAIRLLYLNIIKSLSFNDFIRWRREKTNGEYLAEMRKNALYPAFEHCTRIYEFVWYNEVFSFDYQAFEKSRPEFEKLQRLISANDKAKSNEK
jgi:hypothetical protein